MPLPDIRLALRFTSWPGQPGSAATATLPPRLLGAVLALLVCTAVPVHAAAHIRIETQAATTSNGKPAAALLINGTVVARVAKDDGDNPPLRQISAAATLLASAYRSGRFVLKVQASDKGDRRWVLFLNGAALLIASDQEAKAWGVEPQSLAETWQANISGALQDSPAPVLAPAAAQPVPSPSQPPLSANASVAARPAPGAGTIQTVSPPTPQPPPVKFQKVYEPPSTSALAGPATLPSGAVVTGSNPGPEVMSAAVASALRTQLRLGADDPLTWRPSSGDLATTVTPGQSRSLTLDYVTAAGNGSANVILQNIALSAPRESQTLFSNAPESVYAPQLLYSATLPAGRAARLVYHHQSQVEGGVRLVVRVVSESDPGALHVVPGIAPPDVNTFYVGFKSAENFWGNLNTGAGYALTIPSGGQGVLVNQQLARGYTASGYLKLTNLGAQALRVEVLALATGAALPHGAAADNAKTTRSVYAAPFLGSDNVYHVGDSWLYLRLGDQEPPSETDKTVLHGCYGMTHSFDVTLSNPGETPALAYVVLRASAGEVKGQFYINGEYISTPLVAAGEEQVLKEIPLPPGTNQVVKIRGIALNGGFYPASVIIRETRFP